MSRKKKVRKKKPERKSSSKASVSRKSSSRTPAPSKPVRIETATGFVNLDEAFMNQEECWGCGATVPVPRLTEGLCPFCHNMCVRPGESRPSQYAGESDGKRLARYCLYETVRRKLDWAAPIHRKGWAVVIAGDEAGEMGCLRDCLGWSPDQVLVVDKDIRGIKAAEEKWSGVQCWHGDIRDALAQIGDISFFHLDLCGMFGPDVVDILESCRGRVCPGGVVAYTFFRGMEKSSYDWWVKTKREALSIMGRAFSERGGFPDWRSNMSPEYMARSMGYWWRGAKALSTRGMLDFQPILFDRYHSGQSAQKGSPMGTIAWQSIPTRVPRGAKYTQLDAALDVVRGIDRIEMRDVKMEDDPSLTLRRMACRMREVMSAKEVASIFNVPTSTVVAWKAHDTRGTYEATG